MTIDEIVKDKIRVDIEREQALEKANQLAISAVKHGELALEEIEIMSEDELLDWANEEGPTC